MSNKVNKAIKRKFGRSGLRFAKKVTSETLSSKTFSGCLKGFRKGIQEIKNEYNCRKEKEAVEDLRETLKDLCEASGAFTYGCLTIHGDIDKGDARYLEIHSSVWKVVNEICDEINDGLYDFITDIDDEKYDVGDVFIHQIHPRIFVGAGLVPYEIEVFHELWNATTKK